MNNYKDRSFFILGTLINIKVPKENEFILDMCIDRLKEINNKMSAFEENSDVYKINSSCGKRYIRVDKETLFVIKESLKYSKISNGLFDITVKPLVDTWRKAGKKQSVPDDKEIENSLKLINYKNISIIFSYIKLKNIGQKIDLGGIAKGYAADCILELLKKYKVKSAVIDLGGNVLTLGKKLDNSLWKVGIQNPFENRGGIVGFIESSGNSIVTSGSYERFIEIDGEKYHHFLNTKTGYPLNNGIVSVTIISDKSIEGDGLTSCVFSMGIEKGIELLKNIKNVFYIIIDDNKDIYISDKIKESFCLVDNTFKLI